VPRDQPSHQPSGRRSPFATPRARRRRVAVSTASTQAALERWRTSLIRTKVNRRARGRRRAEGPRGGDHPHRPGAKLGRASRPRPLARDGSQCRGSAQPFSRSEGPARSRNEASLPREERGGPSARGSAGLTGGTGPSRVGTGRAPKAGAGWRARSSSRGRASIQGAAAHFARQGRPWATVREAGGGPVPDERPGQGGPSSGSRPESRPAWKPEVFVRREARMKRAWVTHEEGDRTG